MNTKFNTQHRYYILCIALVPYTIKDNAMDPAYIKPFVMAVKRVFETMIMVPFSLGKPELKQTSDVPYEISSIIGLSGSVTG